MQGGYGRGAMTAGVERDPHPPGIRLASKILKFRDQTGGIDRPRAVRRCVKMIYNEGVDQWLEQAAAWLRETHGLESGFAKRMALFLAYCFQYGLNPVVQSGWRDPAYQKALRARWDRGDRAGLRARPAATSEHTATDWKGDPAARACDVTTTNDGLAARIARALNIGAGLYFRDPDPGHYYA